MADLERSSGSWDKIDSLIRREEKGLAQSGAAAEQPLAVIEEYTAKMRSEKLDLIGRFKAKRIERKAALDTIRTMHESQLEATKHALKRAVDVQKERVDLIAKKYIFEITEEYLRDMQVMGIHNYQARMQTLFALNDETGNLLKQAEAQDVPARIKEKTMEAILKKYNEFYDRLVAEEKALD